MRTCGRSFRFYHYKKRGDDLYHTKEKLLNDILMCAFDDLIFIMKVDLEMNFTYEFINQTAQRKLNISESQLGKTISEIFEPERADFLRKHHRRAASSGLTVKFTDTYMSTLEKKQYMNTKLVPFFNEDGICQHIVSIVNDSTEFFHWQNQLQKREEEFRAVAETSNNLMSIVNSWGIINYASPSHKTVLGYEECQGEHIESILHAEDKKS